MMKRMIGALVALGGIAAFGQGFGGGNSLLEPAMTFDEAVAAAKKGEARGYYQLAIKFSAGEELTRNRATGMAFLSKAADMGYANAQFVLGSIKELRIQESGRDLGANAFQMRLLFMHGLAAQTGAYFWDGNSTATTFADGAAVCEVSNLYARAAAGGVEIAKKKLEDFLQKKQAYDAYETMRRGGQSSRETHDAQVAEAFAGLIRPEYPLPESDGDIRPLVARDPNAYLDAAQANDVRRARKNGMRSSSVMASEARAAWRKEQEAKNAEFRKRYADLRIDSICGVRFGEKPPKGCKPHHQMKLQKKFRFFDSYYLELSSDGRVSAVTLNAKLNPGMKADDIEAEKGHVMAALEKKFAFKFPRTADGKLDEDAFHGPRVFGRYKIELFDFDMEGVPGMTLMVKDMQIVREDAEKRGVPKTIPASEGLDAL